MRLNRHPIPHDVSQSIRQATVIDVYALVEELQREFPDLTEAELEHIVSEEIISANGNAVWSKRDD